MAVESAGAVGKYIGWVGVGLFAATWVELAIPATRRAAASILPLQVVLSLVAASILCFVASRTRRWFLAPALTALLSLVLLLVAVFLE